MKQSNIPIVFFGTPRFAQIVLEKLVKSPFKPSLIVTAPDTRSSRGQKIIPTPVKITAEKYGIKILQPHNLKTLNSQLSTFNFDVAILVAYGKIIPKDILTIPEYGFINVHPSLLPKYRGPSPIQSAILAGENRTGVSIILLDEEVDHGPVLAQKEIPIDPQDTHDTLAEKLAEEGAGLLLESLPDYLKGNLDPKPQIHTKAIFTKHSYQGATLHQGRTLVGKPQDENLATFTRRFEKTDGYIDLKNPPSPQTLDHMIRAYYPWPGVWTKIKWKVESGKWKVLKIKLIPAVSKHQQDTILVQPEGKKPMSIKEFLNGYPQAKELIGKLHLI